MVFITGNYCTSRTLTNTENNTGRLAYVVLAERYEPRVPCFWQLLYRTKRYWQEREPNKNVDSLATCCFKKVLNSLWKTRGKQFEPTAKFSNDGTQNSPTIPVSGECTVRTSGRDCGGETLGYVTWDLALAQEVKTRLTKKQTAHVERTQMNEEFFLGINYFQLPPFNLNEFFFSPSCPLNVLCPSIFFAFSITVPPCCPNTMHNSDKRTAGSSLCSSLDCKQPSTTKQNNNKIKTDSFKCAKIQNCEQYKDLTF